MNDADFAQFSEMLLAMAEIYNKELSGPTIKLYWQILKPYPIEKITIAAQNILTRRKYSTFPLPADFIEYINPQASLEERASVAVELVLDKMEFKGSWYSVSFEDKLIHATIERLGGWIKLCAEVRQMQSKELPFWKRDFIRLYSALAKMPNLESPGSRLIGRCEADNIARGYLNPETMILTLPNSDPVKIGFDGVTPEKQNQLEYIRSERKINQMEKS
ncbi:MAG: hypothetical protein JRJ62_14755 [Deltaproteobacteria bacterium]|nr:hypothetical protein [Deltaproteobacteria bacterium]